MSSWRNTKEIFIEEVRNLIFSGSNDEILNMENDVINKNIPELSYYYASKVKGANIREHENIVADNKDLMWVYLFVKSVKGANIDRLSNIIIESGDAYYNYMTALNVDGVDKRKHGMVVFLANDPEYNYLFAKNIDCADIKLHEKAVALSENARFINKFMRDIPGCDLNILSKSVIRGGNPYWNYAIARDYGVNVLEHGNVVYRSLDPGFNYKFALDVDGADIKLHGQAICLSKDKEYMDKFNNLISTMNNTKKLVREKNN